MKAIDRLAFNGHAALMGRRDQLWQETLYVGNGYEWSLDASLLMNDRPFCGYEYAERK